MFGRQNQTDYLYEGTAGEEYLPRPSRAQRRARERADTERLAELRWQWLSVCTATSLAQFIYTPSGVTKAAPKIGQIELGPPVSFTVRIRPGQTLADFVKAGPAIAAAMNVAEIEVTRLVAAQWLRIVLRATPSVAVGVGA